MAKRRAHKIGHDAQIDGIANVIGFSPASGPEIDMWLSFRETQNHAGWLDGALGVVYALEAARYLQETGADFGVDVIAFSDEEGHFGELTGSNSLIGNVTEDMLDIAVDRTSGKKLRDALSDNGLSDVPRVILDADRYVGMFEAHIEQGPSLKTIISVSVLLPVSLAVGSTSLQRLVLKITPVQRAWIFAKMRVLP